MFLMITAQSNARFGRSIDILSPYHEFRDVILKIISGPQSSYDNIFVYPVIIIEFLFGVYTLLILYLVFKKLPPHYSIYTLSSVILIFFGSSFSSIIRYLLPIFPAYIILSLLLSKKQLIFLSIVSLLLLVFASSLFLRNYWIS